MSSEKSTNDAAEINLLDDGMSAERARNAKGTALRLLKKLMEQRWKLLVVIVSIIISSVFTVLSPKLIGIAMKYLSPLQNTQRYLTAFRAPPQAEAPSV